MKYAYIITTLGTVLLVGCSALGPPASSEGEAAYPGFSGAEYRDTMITAQAKNSFIANSVVQAPTQCFARETQAGQPVRFHRESIIDQPVLMSRKALRVPSQPIADRNFFCASFYYSIDQNGRVADVQTLYNSHPGVGGINFAKEAKRTLKDWRYEPGMVDKGRAKFTGFTTVFYYGFDS